MKVLLVSHTALMGGAERCLLDLARGLVQRKTDVIALCPSVGPLTETLSGLGIPVSVKRMRRPGRHVLKLVELLATWPGVVRELGAWMRQQSVTVVYNNTVDALYAPFAAAQNRIPCIWHVHEARPDQRWARLLIGRMIAKVATRAVFNSVATLNAFYATPDPPDHWSVIYNGVSVPEIPPPEPTAGGPSVVGFVGDMRPHKRPELFLTALALARKQVPHLRGVVVGDGTLFERVQATASELGLGEVVTFMGRVENLSDFYATIDLLVLTSQREGFGRVIVEAMGSRVPVIAASVGGVPEVIEDGQTGYLISTADAPSFAKRIVELARNPELRLQMGNAGRKRVLEHFGLDRYCHDLICELESAARR